ncbi:MAG: glycosyltransferase family 2 protein [Bacteroidota bacterium]|nr:glycosyltransferase family 2 protein [Bacteroidota bacterium]
MPGDQPLVSVLMTAYNRKKYIAEAIESVLNSTYKNFELIVVDDASVDDTVTIAKSYGKKDDRIKVYVNENNLGQFPNRNKAASLANGWLIFWVDSDDTIKPDAIEYVVTQFMAHPEVKFSTIYQKGDLHTPTVMKPEDSIRNNYFKEGFLNIGPGGTVIESSYFKSIGGFPEKYGPIGDKYYNVKAAANTNILLLPYDYLNYRRHEQQEINNTFSYLCDGHRYLADLMQRTDLPLTKEEKNNILKKSARANMLSFLRNIKNTGEIKKTFRAFRISGIKLKDLL